MITTFHSPFAEIMLLPTPRSLIRMSMVRLSHEYCLELFILSHLYSKGVLKLLRLTCRPPLLGSITITETVLLKIPQPGLHTRGVRIRNLEKDVVYASSGESKYAHTLFNEVSTYLDPQCDEKHPQCGQCMARRTACSYVKAAPEIRPAQSGSSPYHNTRHCTGAIGLSCQVSESDTFAASVNSIADAQGWPKATSSHTYVQLLSCFYNSTIATLSSTTAQRIMLSNITQHFHTYPFLLHAAFALTAAHLTCVSGRASDFATTAFYHTQQALGLYGKRLQRVEDRTEMDAVLAACFMLTPLFYLSHDKFNTTESWIFPGPDSTSKPNWSTVISGPALLLQSTEFTADADESSWLPFMRESQELVRQATTTAAGPGDRLVTLLHDILSKSHCDSSSVHFEGITQTNPYLPAFNALTPVLRAHFDPVTMTIGPCVDIADFISLMTFPSRLGSVFIERLSRRDNIALLLVGFWFALLAKLQHCRWWCLHRALAEGRAIYVHLSNVQFLERKFKEAISVLARAFFT